MNIAPPSRSRSSASLFVAAVGFSSALLFAPALGQSLLEKRFSIAGPVFEYGDLQFDMDFTVSDYIKDGMIGYELYDGLNCRDGGDVDITENDGYLRSRLRPDLTPRGDGSGMRQIKVTANLAPDLIANSGIYRDAGTHGLVEFCLRFGVYNVDRDSPAANAIEANFLEVPVKLTINLSGGFALDADISNAEVVVQRARANVAVEAYLCDNDDNVVAVADDELRVAQGKSVRICVSPNGETLAKGAAMKRVEEFRFARDDATQVSISPNSGGVAADALTVVSCQPGSTVCAFETLLGAAFFEGAGTVTGTGTAYLQLVNGDDSAATGRKLQGSGKTANELLSEQPTEYSVTLFVVPVERFTSANEVSSGANSAYGAFAHKIVEAVVAAALFSVVLQSILLE